MSANPKTLTREEAIARNTAADYAKSMFQDGHNRTETNKKAHDAPDYDAAAHTPDAEFTAELALTVTQDTFHSRDGTDASGSLDADGGSLGGTEAELDALEAGGTPVDRNPRMKE